MPKDPHLGQLSPEGAQAGREVAKVTNGHKRMVTVAQMAAQIDIESQKQERSAIKIRK